MNTNPIPRRRLGAADLEVSALGLGCMGMSDFYGPADDAQSLAVLNHALDIGINFLDTADMYGVGANERLLAQLLKTRRDEVVLATKFGNVRAPDGAGAQQTKRSAHQQRTAARLGQVMLDHFGHHLFERDFGRPAQLVARLAGIDECVGEWSRGEDRRVRHRLGAPDDGDV